MSYAFLTGDSVQALKDQLAAAGSSPLPRVHIYDEAGGNRSLKVVPNGVQATAVTKINDSHVCPGDPLCS